jgi:hypothetical protein
MLVKMGLCVKLQPETLGFTGFLGRERGAATASGGGVRVIENKTSVVQSAFKIYFAIV